MPVKLHVQVKIFKLKKKNFKSKNEKAPKLYVI